MRTKNAKPITPAERAPRKGWHERRFEARPTAVQRQCEHCGRDMWLPKSKVGEYRTCGGACAAALKSAPAKGRLRHCETCGSSFTPRARQLQLGQGRYCSQKCNAAIREAASRPEVRARMKATRLANVEQWAWKCRGENSGRWRGGRKATYERQKAAGVIRDYNNRRRSFRRKRLPKGTIPMLEQKQKMRCANCRTSLRKGYHLDHIVPISRGGEHEPGNVQLLCPPCNIRKHNKMPHEWAQANGRLL